MKKLTVEDFAKLREPQKLGGRSPSALANMLISYIILQAIIFAIEYFAGVSFTNYPYNKEILIVHFWIIVAHVILSIIFSIQAVFRKAERIQYLVYIVVNLNMFGVSFFILALFLLGSQEENTGITQEFLLNYTYLALLIGLVVFVVAFLRYYLLLHKGHFRKGETKETLLERLMDRLMLGPGFLIVGIGLVLIMLYLNEVAGFVEDRWMTMAPIFIGHLCFYATLFVLPEQIVVLYCKFRFKSFNFNIRGSLMSED
ncbi:hypothetical protein [Sporosarcina sp. NPDC096371]|uniref:hypothetical protein n=1 Tax=Sporosarcina sp. NPDC096371 TaxID=3364530 RepID=UPI00382731A7